MGDVKLAACLRALMLAYERRIRSDCTTSEELAKEPWRCAEYVAAEDALKPMKLQFTVEGLRNRIATESDEASYEAGVLHPEAPSPAAPVDGGFAAGIEAAAECADAQAARLRENGHSAMALQLDYCSEDIRALAPTALQAENERLRAALERHGGHDEHCRWHKFDDEDHDRYPCTCGLDAALRPAT